MRPMPRTVRPAAIAVGRRPDMAWIAVTCDMGTVPPVELNSGRDATASAQPAIGEHTAPAPDIPARVPPERGGQSPATGPFTAARLFAHAALAQSIRALPHTATSRPARHLMDAPIPTSPVRVAVLA